MIVVCDLPECANMFKQRTRKRFCSEQCQRTNRYLYGAPCHVAACDQPIVGLGLCRMHWARQHNGLDLYAPKKVWHQNGGLCIFEGCTNTSITRELCYRHYKRLQVHGDATIVLVQKHNRGQLCSVTDCLRPCRKRGMCGSHYTTLWRQENPEKATNAKRASSENRRRKITMSNRHTIDEWLDLKSQFGGLCTYCMGEATERDHIVPIVLGGADTIDNITPSCRRCNRAKWTTPLLPWLMSRSTTVASPVAFCSQHG